MSLSMLAFIPQKDQSWSILSIIIIFEIAKEKPIKNILTQNSSFQYWRNKTILVCGH
jgi:hypothetical protein